MPNENPFQDPLRFERRVPECAIVIFGANGDLTKRKLLPALYRLAYDRRLSAGFAVVGISRTPLSDDAVPREDARARRAVLRGHQASIRTCGPPSREGLFYVAGDIDDPGLYQRLAERLGRDRERAATPAATCCSTSPRSPASTRRSRTASARRGWAKASGWRRLVVEKPFGHDLASARELSDRLHEVFDESDVYRIDHYLGKETVQNILAFRFGNGIFEPLWNRRYVNHVQITAAESIGVEGRGAYYQEAGALRDMIQNHLLQVMATIAMEPSASFRATCVRDERSKLLRSIRPMTARRGAARTRCPASTARRASAARMFPGFRQEAGRGSADSQTNTYAAVTFFVDNWRWAGVPFYVRTGKRLPKRVSEIAIQFNSAPLASLQPGSGETSAPTC